MRSALLPTTLWGKFPFVVAERVIRRPKFTSSWTGSESECRVAVCVGFLLGRSPSAVKHVHIVFSLEACWGPNAQDKTECLMVATCHLLEDVIALHRQRNTCSLCSPVEACESLNTLDRVVHLTAETCQLFVTSHSRGESIRDSTRCLRNSAIIP